MPLKTRAFQVKIGGFAACVQRILLTKLTPTADAEVSAQPQESTL